MYLYVLTFFSKGSFPRTPTSTSVSNIDKTITSSSHSFSRKDVPDSADGETSVAGVLSSSPSLYVGFSAAYAAFSKFTYVPKSVFLSYTL